MGHLRAVPERVWLGRLDTSTRTKVLVHAGLFGLCSFHSPNVGHAHKLALKEKEKNINSRILFFDSSYLRGWIPLRN